jgi:hypothetical protein
MADWQFVPREPQELRVRPARLTLTTMRIKAGGEQ